MGGRLTRRAIAALAMAPGAALGGDLAPYHWKSRVLLVFAEEDAPALRDQHRRIMAARGGMAERDMAVIAVVGAQRVEHWLGAPGQEDAAALRARFAVPPSGFAAILLGKDGGEKWRVDRPADPEEVFALVDTMPMRRREAGQG
ncbi:DUF4174 domain-containing protein [Pseudoroseomonas globiformis]|uniref:DUF4174 domain-containing protein n=1 Tax=Teichococcus globiformis TaxID=2307229 RepID=A0ABV7G2X6_9PROT